MTALDDLKNITDRLSRLTNIQSALETLFRKTWNSESEEEVALVCLQAAEKLTQSQFGFIDEVNPDGETVSCIAMSNPGWKVCGIPLTEARKLLSGVPIQSFWGRTIKEAKSQIVNDPNSDKDSIGLPEGHPPIHSFLGVPLKYKDNIYGIIALANKNGGYNKYDQEAIEALADAFLEVLLRKRAEQEERSRFINQKGVE